MDKYEQLKKVIQEANPEIMELKFGCEVSVSISGAKLYGLYLGYEETHFVRIYSGEKYPYAVRGVVIQDKKDLVVFGRPIRLADVLLTAKTNLVEGKASRLVDMLLNQFTKEHWNLKDDNLDHQSDETKQFLIDLLV